MSLSAGVKDGGVPRLTNLLEGEDWAGLFESWCWDHCIRACVLFVEVVRGEKAARIAKSAAGLSGASAVERMATRSQTKAEDLDGDEKRDEVAGGAGGDSRDENVTLYHKLVSAIIAGPAAGCIHEDNVYDGKALLEAVLKKIRGIGVNSCQQLRQKLRAVTFKSVNYDSEQFFSRLEAARTRINHVAQRSGKQSRCVDELELVDIILYQLRGEERFDDLRSSITTLDEDADDYYRQVKSRVQTRLMDVHLRRLRNRGQQALVAEAGECRNCRKPGHTEAQCWGSGGGSEVVCDSCGLHHPTDLCRKKCRNCGGDHLSSFCKQPGGARFRSTKAKSKGHKASLALDGGSVSIGDVGFCDTYHQAYTARVIEAPPMSQPTLSQSAGSTKFHVISDGEPSNVEQFSPTGLDSLARQRGSAIEQFSPTGLDSLARQRVFALGGGSDVSDEVALRESAEAMEVSLTYPGGRKYHRYGELVDSSDGKGLAWALIVLVINAFTSVFRLANFFSRREFAIMIIVALTCCALPVLGDSDHCAFATGMSPSNRWAVDSACTIHMTGDESLFEAHWSIPNVPVRGVGGTLNSSKAGSLHIPVLNSHGEIAEVFLEEVLFVPGLKQNLISVSSLVKSNHTVVMNETSSRVELDGQTCPVPLEEWAGLFLLPVRPPQANVSVVSDYALAHRRLGHAGESTVAAATGLKNDSGEPCASCLLNKAKHKSFAKVRPPGKRSEVRFERIHTDVWSSKELSVSGSLYAINFIDDYTRESFVYFMKTKDQAADMFQRFMREEVTPAGLTVTFCRSDNGGEYTGEVFEQALRDHGVKPERCPPYGSQANGVAERWFGTVIPMAKAMVHDANLSTALWPEAVSTANDIHNMLPTSSLAGNLSPHEFRTGKAPDFSRLRVFGSPCYVVDENAPKFGPNAKRMVFLGYSKVSSTYRCFNPYTASIIRTAHVTFDEAALPSWDTVGWKFPDVASDRLEADAVADGAGDGGEYADMYRPELTSAPSELPGRYPSRSRTRVDLGPMVYNVTPGPFCTPAEIVHHAYLGCISSGCDPRGFDWAMRGPDAALWQNAMDKEFRALIDFETWEYVQLPEGARAIGSSWVLKIKYNSDGTVQLYKARVVARGDHQRAGVDFNKTWAPVCRLESVRVLIALAAQEGWEMFQSDVDNAFLNSDVDADIYVRQPRGYKRYGPNGEELVLKLKKALYGIKQAPYLWNSLLHKFLVGQGMQRSEVDPCIYFRFDEDGGVTICAIYVDDIVFTGSNTAGIEQLRGALSERFKIKDLGELNHFLGIKVERAGSGIKLSQERYAETLLERFGMAESHPVSTPLVPKVKLTKAMSPATASERQLMQSVPYRQAVGGLMYLAVATRPDIANSVRDVARFLNDPGWQHWMAVKHILRYLRGTSGVGLTYKPLSDDLRGFADSDWANCPETSRSVTGHVFILAGASVSWRSRSQKTVALSSSEAEYYALGDAGGQAVFLRQLLDELGRGISGPTTIAEDNRGCIGMVANEVPHSRTKHIRLRHHYIRELARDGVIAVEAVSSRNQLADMFTKNLNGVALRRMRALVMG